MISSIAEKVIANRGKIRRARVAGVLIHTTGSGLADAARAARDPEQVLVHHYLTAATYPHYAIAWDGSIYAFCDELRWSAHAAWSPKEKVAYAAGFRTWSRLWVNTAGGQTTAQRVEPTFYRAWVARWQGRGLEYDSPLSLLKQIGGDLDGPNEQYIGVEVLDAKPFTRAQHEALAALIRDVFQRHGFDTQVLPGSLPQAWLCTHSDVSPMRRWQRTREDRKLAVPKEGYPWDTLEAQLDWRLIERLLASG